MYIHGGIVEDGLITQEMYKLDLLNGVSELIKITGANEPLSNHRCVCIVEANSNQQLLNALTSKADSDFNALHYK